MNAETPNEAGNTPLHLAACEGHLEVVKYLIEELHAPMYASNNDGVDPFHAAVDASNGGAVEVVGWLASRPTPPAEAMKRTRLLQRRLRRADDVTDPLLQPDPKQVKVDEADEARWVAEEEAREARIAKASMVGAALSDGGGIWSMLSNRAAAKSKQAKAGASAGSGSVVNLLSLMGQVEASDVTASAKGPMDEDIAVELREIEWNNLANGATISENGVTTAVRGKQLSVNAVYRRLLKARPEWCSANRADWENPDLKERVRGLNELSRAAAGTRWLRYLSKDARNPDEPWAWVAPSAVFGEVLAGSTGMAVPGPGTALAVVARPAGAISDWATSGGNEVGGQVGAPDSGQGLRPQGREAIARSSMAAADAHWALMHPEEAEAPAVAYTAAGKGSNRRGEASKQARSSSSSAAAAKWRNAKQLASVSFANQQQQAAHIAEAAAGAAAGNAEQGAGDDGRARLRGRRGAVLASDFTKAWTEGAQVDSSAAPESVGDRTKRQAKQAAARAAEDAKKRSPRSRVHQHEGDEERKRREVEEEEDDERERQAAAESGAADDAVGDRDGVKRFESRVQFIHRVHRDRVEGLSGTARMMQVASGAKQEQAAKEEAKKAKAPGAVAARRRAGVMALARQRKQMLSRDFAAV